MLITLSDRRFTQIWIRSSHASPPTPGLVFAVVDEGSLVALRASRHLAAVPVTTREMYADARAAGLAAHPPRAGAATALWGASAVADVTRVRPTTVAGPGYQVSPSVFWHAEIVPGRETLTFVTDTDDVSVLIVPADAELPPQSAARLPVGGRPAWLVAVQRPGAGEVRIFQVRGPGSFYLIALQGTPADLDRRAQEITDLLGSVQWAGAS
jgi:hypothetical protein